MNYQKIYHTLCMRGKEKRSINPKWGRKERHHIIPRHIGGSNDSSNITTLQHKEHILAHHLLYAIDHRPEDKVAYRMMKGVIKDYWSDLDYAQKMKDKVIQNLQKVDRNKQKEATSKAGKKAFKEHKGIHTTEAHKEAIKATKEWAKLNPDLASQRSSRSHKNRTKEDYIKMANTKSHYIIISPEGLKFNSVAEAANHYNLPKYSIDNWVRRKQKGWKRIQNTDK